eukprot:6062104-Alexandrium_andersonii.AAC.1
MRTPSAPHKACARRVVSARGRAVACETCMTSTTGTGHSAPQQEANGRRGGNQAPRPRRPTPNAEGWSHLTELVASYG